MSLVQSENLESPEKPKEWHELDTDTLFHHIGKCGLRIPLASVAEGVGVCTALLVKLQGHAKDVNLSVAGAEPTNRRALLTLSVTLREDK